MSNILLETGDLSPEDLSTGGGYPESLIPPKQQGYKSNEELLKNPEYVEKQPTIDGVIQNLVNDLHHIFNSPIPMDEEPKVGNAIDSTISATYYAIAEALKVYLGASLDNDIITFSNFQKQLENAMGKAQSAILLNKSNIISDVSLAKLRNETRATDDRGHLKKTTASPNSLSQSSSEIELMSFTHVQKYLVMQLLEKIIPSVQKPKGKNANTETEANS